MSNVTQAKPGNKPLLDGAGDGEVISETRAKQGRRGLHMFAVLAISTVLAVVVLFGLWSLYAGKLNQAAHTSGAAKAAAAQTFNTGDSQPAQTAP